MKRPILIISNLIIILVIVAGFTGIVYKDTKDYQDLAEKHMQNIVTLADTDISKQIENSMSKPVTVSKTMANDTFLKSWLSQEAGNTGNSAYLKQIYSYLKLYQIKYNYSSVFCISAKTGNYYYQDGFNKTISSTDEHDIWYFNFVSSGQEHDLEVDTNQADNDTITVFVNFRVEGANGELLGVIGVGLQVSSIEETIRDYEKEFDLSVYIINVGGAENSFKGGTDIFISRDELAERTGIKGNIVIDKSANSDMQWFTSDKERQCLITNYDETLGWYLVLEKDTNSISRAFQERVQRNILFVLISLLACIAVTTAVFANYNKRMVEIENTDELAGLWNRKYFSLKYPSFIRKHRRQANTLFMFDIDNFKNFNDRYGHVFGNAVISEVGEALKKTVGRNGIAGRWGGDEFVGILAAPPDETERILKGFMDGLKNNGKANRLSVTVSVGITKIDMGADMVQMIKEVDEAMYRSKNGGRDRITVKR